MCAASTRTSCASGSTAASPASASTPPRWSSRTRPARGRLRARARASTRTSTATSCTRSTARWRAIADSYGPPRVLIGELWLPDADRFARYLRPDELHTAFNFDFMACPWDADRAARARSSDTLAATRRSAPRRPGSCPTTTSPAGDPLRPRRHVVLVRRQAVRHADRPRPRRPAGPGRGAAGDGAARRVLPVPGRGARAARGRGPPARPASRTRCTSAPAASTPVATAAACRCRGRATTPPYGFSPAGAEPTWLPQPADWAGLTVEAQAADPGSMLALYRARLAAAPRPPTSATATSRWLDPPRPTCSRSGAATSLRRQPRHRAGGPAVARRVLLASGRLTRPAAIGHRRLVAPRPDARRSTTAPTRHDEQGANHEEPSTDDAA